MSKYSMLRKVEHDMDVYNAWDKVTIKSLNSIPQSGDTNNLNLSKSSKVKKSPQISIKIKKKQTKQEYIKSHKSKVI